MTKWSAIYGGFDGWNERAYFEQVRASAVARVLRTLSSQDLQKLPEFVEGETLPAVQGGEATLSSVRQKLQAAMDLEKMMLDGVVSSDDTFPYSSLEQIRGSLVRDIVRKNVCLVELQGKRQMIERNPTDDS